MKLHDLTSCFSSRTLRQTTNYIFTSYLTHFRLFQRVFTQPRDSNQTTTQLAVDRPTDLLSMREGQEQSVWEKEEKLKSINSKHAEKLQALETKRHQEQEEIEVSRHKSLDESLGDDSNILDIKDLVSQSIHDQTTATSRVLSGEIEDHKSRLKIHMEILALKSPVFASALVPDSPDPLPLNSSSRASVSRTSVKGGASPNRSASNVKEKAKKKKKGKS